MEVAKHPREDPSTGQSRRSHSCYRSQNHLHRPLPQSQRRCQSPSSSPPWSCPADEQLSHSLGDLHLHSRPQKFQSRVQTGDAPTCTKECLMQEPMEGCAPKDWKTKRVRFDHGEDFGQWPFPIHRTDHLPSGRQGQRMRRCAPIPLHPCLWIHCCCLSARVCSTIPPTSEGLAQWYLPNPLLLDPNPSHGSKRHQTWWSTFANGSWRRLIGFKPTLTCEKRPGPAKSSPWGSSPRRCIIWENFSKAKAFNYAQWHSEAFKLPLAKHEALGWWDAPAQLCRLCP